MLFALTLVAAEAHALPTAQSRAAQALAMQGARVTEPRPLGPGALDLLVEGEEPALRRLRKAASDAAFRLPVDVCLQPFQGRKKRLLISDMDSTIVGCECIDELADFAGIKAEVAAITEAGMRGEIDFEQGLRQRVKMLTGLKLQDVETCIAERVRINPGAGTLVRTMAAQGAECLLVSGGFTLFVDRVAKEVGFHGSMSNLLEIKGDRLSGQVLGPVFGSGQKLKTLQDAAARLGIGLDQALAVGDGANDLAMIEAAGLGVAYRAKPVVAAKADARVDHGDLTALLYFQGYRAEEFVQ